MNIIKSMLLCIFFMLSRQIAAMELFTSHNKTYTLQEAKEELKKNPYALHDACNRYKDNNYQKAKMLIEARAEINSQDINSYAPLHYAVCNDNSAMLTLLIATGANIMVKDDFGKTLLCLASSRGTPESIEILIQAGADINEQSAFLSHTPLMNALTNNLEQENALKLIELGAGINCQDQRNHTALHMAARTKKSKVTQLLLEKSADPFQQAIDGRTSLHFAAQSHFSNPNTTLTCAIILGNLGFFDSSQDDIPNPDSTSDKKLNNQLIRNYYKKKLFKLTKELISIKNKNGKTATEIANLDQDQKAIALLTQVENAQSYSKLPQKIKTIAKENIEKHIQYKNS